MRARSLSAIKPHAMQIRLIGGASICHHLVQFVEQGLGLLQIARTKILPWTNRRLVWEFPELCRAHFERAATWPGSAPHAAPRTLLVALTQSRPPVRIGFPRHPARVQAKQLPRRCDIHRPRTTSSWLFRSLSLPRRYSGWHRWIDGDPHRLSPSGTSTTASTMSIPLTVRRLFQR